MQGRFCFCYSQQFSLIRLIFEHTSSDSVSNLGSLLYSLSVDFSEHNKMSDFLDKSHLDDNREIERLISKHL